MPMLDRRVLLVRLSQNEDSETAMRFRDISISWKLTLLAVVTTLLAMLGVFWALAVIDRQLSKMAMVENYVTLADVLGQYCQKSINSTDPAVIQRDLAAIQKDIQVELASLYRPDGSERAVVQRHGAQAPTLEWAQQMNGTFSSDGFLHIIRPIRKDSVNIGYVYLKVSISRLTSAWWDQFVVTASMFSLSLIAAVVLATRLQRFISGPVLHLVDTAHQVTKSRDFSIRAAKETGDELGELVDKFNEMLSTIEARDAALEGHQQNLEDLVQERTIELEQKTQEAMAASVAKTVFLANMSHEIRTPMNAIIGFANILREGNVANQEEQLEFLNIICSSGQHLLGLINDILDLSKIEAGCMKAEIIPVSPHQLIADVVSITRVNALNKGLGLDYTWVGPVPRIVMTDPAKLRQLLINLIGNAIKFTENGGVHVIARLGVNQRQLQIQVIDSGIGIAADKVDRIFNPFSQADESMTRRFGGTGLGLSISRKIAELLGGNLIVESDVGVGSTFTATVATGEIGELDRRVAPPVSDVIPTTELDVTETTMTIPKGSRVLLVEDGDTNRRLIHKMLERHGVEVMDAVNGQIGVDLATTLDFDVILMDMQMPVKDGYTAATELRSKGLTIPIVALTAHALSGDAEKCRNAGCSDYLAKPIQEARLVTKLAELLNQKDEKKTTRPVSPSSSFVLPRMMKPDAEESYQSFEDEVVPAKGVKIHVACALPLDDETFREIVQEFSDKLQLQVDRMRYAYASEDWNELVELAHWLKGSGGTAGYEQFTIPSSRLERMAMQRSHERIEFVLDEIEALAKAVAAELDQLPALV